MSSSPVNLILHLLGDRYLRLEVMKISATECH